MRVISYKISLDSLKSRYNGVVPYATDIWRTPLGNFMSQTEAENAMLDNNYSLSEIKKDRAFVDVTLNDNQNGNRGYVPCDIPTASYSKYIDDSALTTSYSSMMTWYRKLKSYYNMIGDYSNAEEYYINTVGIDNAYENDIERYREMDKEVEELNNTFVEPNEPKVGNAFDWMNENMFNSTGTTDAFGNIDDRKATLTLPILITSNIDDIGEFSIFSNVYRKDLWSTPNVNDENTLSSGDVFSGKIERDINGTSYVDETSLNTMVIKNQDNSINVTFTPYSSTTMNGDNMVSREKYYLDVDGNVIVDPEQTTTDNTYKLHNFDYGFVYMNGDVREISQSKYVIFSGDTNSTYNGRWFPAYELMLNQSAKRFSGHDYYCDINNRKYLSKNGRFYFKSKLKCDNDDNGCPVLPIEENQYIDYLMYGGTMIEPTTIEGDEWILPTKYIPIDDGEYVTYYPIFDSYFRIGNTMYFVIKKTGVPSDIYNIYIQNGITTIDNVRYAEFIESNPLGCDSYVINGDEIIISFNAQEVYNYTLTGYTSSKLSLFRDMISSYDMMGNQLPGNFQTEWDVDREKERYETSSTTFVNSKVSEPYNGKLLEFPYHIGNSNEVYEVSGSVDTKIYGDLLSKIDIIGYDGNGEKVDGANINLSTQIETAPTYNPSSSSTWTQWHNMSQNFENIFEKEDVVSVEITFTYNINAQLNKRLYETQQNTPINPTNLSLGYYYIGDDKGIEYKETFNVVKKSIPYHLKKDRVQTLFIYDIEPINKREYINNDYGDELITENICQFSLDVNHLISGFAEENNTWSRGGLNGCDIYPIGREDYKFGFSVPQKLEGNIYIDRGTNAAIARRFKLNEINSVEALKYYGNKYFKIES